eukprot:SAG22_NODE_1807_length_3531_cov_1.988636_6_plen_118_part_00
MQSSASVNVLDMSGADSDSEPVVTVAGHVETARRQRTRGTAKPFHGRFSQVKLEPDDRDLRTPTHSTGDGGATADGASGGEPLQLASTSHLNVTSIAGRLGLLAPVDLAPAAVASCQ